MPDITSQDPTSTDSADPSISDQIANVVASLAVAAPAISAAVVNTNNGLNNPNTMINPNTGLAYNSALYPGAGVGSGVSAVLPFNSSAVWLIMLAVLFLVVVENK